jgi:glycine C-acetyltransferase
MEHKLFKAGMKNAGFDIVEGDSAIVPVMLYDAKLSQTMADELLKKGIYVIGFFFPVVPKTKQELEYNYQRTYKEHLDKAINAFIAVGQSLKVV